MSAPAYAAPLRIQPAPSQRLRLLFGLYLSLSLLAVWGSAFAWWLQGLFSLLLGGYGWLAWVQQAALHGKATSVVWDHESRWWWHDAAGEVEMRLLAESFSTPWLIVLRLAAVESGRRECLLLLPDSLDVDTRRRLRVRLALEAGKTS